MHESAEWVIHSELYGIIKFNHTDKYAETSLCPKKDSKIQIDHLIYARKADLVLINDTRICNLLDFAVPANHWKESEMPNKYRIRKTKKL